MERHTAHVSGDEAQPYGRFLHSLEGQKGVGFKGEAGKKDTPRCVFLLL